MHKGLSNLALKLSILLVLAAGCKRKDFKYPEQLDGTWKIVKSERMRIYNDGSTEKFEDLSNAGTLEVFEPTPEAETLKEFVFTYTNFNGVTSVMQSLLSTDRLGQRIFFSKVLCDSPFECDIVWTVDVDKRNRQVWSSYGNEIKFFYPNDRYDPSNDAYHHKWTIELERQ